MRYDQKIYFLVDGANVYNSKTGNYIQGEPVKISAYASVADSTVETQKLIYGEIRHDSLTINILNHADFSFNWIEVDGKRYGIDSIRNYRTKQEFICHEI